MRVCNIDPHVTDTTWLKKVVRKQIKTYAGHDAAVSVEHAATDSVGRPTECKLALE